MTVAAITILMQPQWFLLLFVAMWGGVTALLAHLSGWAGLAKHLRANSPTSGERFRFVSGSMGRSVFPVSYSLCLFINVSDAGFRLSILFPFRLLSPPLFIPWPQVISATDRRFLSVAYTEIRLRDHWPTISIRGEAGNSIRETYTRSSSQTSP